MVLRIGRNKGKEKTKEEKSQLLPTESGHGHGKKGHTGRRVQTWFILRAEVREADTAERGRGTASPGADRTGQIGAASLRDCRTAATYCCYCSRRGSPRGRRHHPRRLRTRWHLCAKEHTRGCVSAKQKAAVTYSSVPGHQQPRNPPRRKSQAVFS